MNNGPSVGMTMICVLQIAQMIWTAQLAMTATALIDYVSSPVSDLSTDI